jgi:bacteriocin biosynthesis cyclodehydratase domain-containing protein
MKTYALKPRIQIVPLHGGQLILFRKHGPSVKLKLPLEHRHEFARLLVHGFNSDELSAVLRLGEKASQSILDQLLKAGMLSALDDHCADEKYQRLAAYLDGYSQAKSPRPIKSLQDRSVCLLGVGGLGSHIFQHLVTNGIQRITIVDCDRIQASNLSRQTLYTDSDIGQLKVDVAQRYASLYGLKVKALPLRVESVDDLLQLWELEKPELVISTIDEPILKITQIVTQAVTRLSIPLLRANSRAVGPFYFPGQSSCPSCLSHQLARNIPKAQDVTDLYQQGFPARRKAAISYELALVSLIVIRDVIHYLARTGLLNTLEYELSWDAEKFALTQRKVPSNPHCPGCGGVNNHDFRYHHS